MPIYEVKIRHIVNEICYDSIEAEDEDEAYEIAEKKYCNGEYDDEFENNLDERAPGGWGYMIEVGEE